MADQGDQIDAVPPESADGESAKGKDASAEKASKSSKAEPKPKSASKRDRSIFSPLLVPQIRAGPLSRGTSK